MLPTCHPSSGAMHISWLLSNAAVHEVFLYSTGGLLPFVVSLQRPSDPNWTV